MAKIKWKGGALLAPLPAVLVSCGSADKPNLITVAWTGITNTVPPKTYISVRPGRHSYGLIKESGEFVINLPSSALARAVDFCGMYTGRKVDKFAKADLTPTPSEEVAVPSVKECPISLECRVTDTVMLGSHEMFLADILCVNVDETCIDKNGRLDIARANLMAFAHGEYFALGKFLGKFGFSAVKKKKHHKKPKENK